MLANRITGPTDLAATDRRMGCGHGQVPLQFAAAHAGRGARPVHPPALADEVTAFVNDHPLAAGGRTVEQILERLGVNVAFGQREGADLAAALTDA